MIDEENFEEPEDAEDLYDEEESIDATCLSTMFERIQC